MGQTIKKFLTLGILITLSTGQFIVIADEKTKVGSQQLKPSLISPPVHIHRRKKVPGLIFKAPSEQNTRVTSHRITVDPKLEITIPGRGASPDQKPYIFKPYTQGFIHSNIKLLHILLPDSLETLLRLQFVARSHRKNLRLLIQTSHYLALMEEHRIFQLRKSALAPINQLRSHLITEIILELQKAPEEKLPQFKTYLQSLRFEDLHGLRPLFEKTLLHLNRGGLSEKAQKSYDWIGSLKENHEQRDTHWTYLHFLDRKPTGIRSGFIRYLRILLYENIMEILPVNSQTYLKYSERLIDVFETLEPDPSLMRDLQLQLEFTRLKFEPYMELQTIYDRLMSLYPNLPGSAENWRSKPRKSKLFFPFFDQLINHAHRRFQRGQPSCTQPLSTQREVCVKTWKEATRFYQYVARYAPFTLLTRESIQKLNRIRDTSVIDFPFISKTELLKLMDKAEKTFR
jgi:hypothetical protein